MLRIQGEYRPHRFFPHLSALSGNPEHEIQIQIVKPGLPGQLHRFHHVLPAVGSPHHLQQSVIHGLNPKAQPVDPRCPVHPQLFFGQGRRVAFHGNLRIRRNIKLVENRREDGFCQVGGQNAWSASPEKHRIHRVLRGKLVSV